MTTRVLRSTILSLIVGIAAIAMAGAASAQVTGFNFGQMGNFAVVIDNVANFQMTSDSGITGNLGIGSMTGSPQFSGGTVNGNVEFESNTLPNGVTAGTPGSGTGGSQTSIMAGVAAVGSAITTMSNLSTYYGGQSGTALNLNIGSGNTTVTVSNGTVAANDSAYVFDVTNWTVNNGGTITISGSASSYVVFDFAAGVTPDFDDAIALTGGITSDHVLFNYTGTSQIQSAANGATVNGTILAPNADISLDHMTLDGRIMAGEVGDNSSIQSGAYVDGPASYTPPAVPEPPSLALLLAALGCLGLVRSVRRHA